MQRDWIWRWPGRLIPITMSIMFCVAGLSVIFGAPPPRQDPGSPIAMRGCIFLVVRLNTRPVPQAINVCDDGTAGRISNPPGRSVSRSMQLTIEQQHQVRALQSQWCSNRPSGFLATDVIPTEDVGIRCDTSYSVTQFRLAPRELPQILLTIDHDLPPLQ